MQLFILLDLLNKSFSIFLSFFLQSNDLIIKPIILIHPLFGNLPQPNQLILQLQFPPLNHLYMHNQLIILIL